jgi:hypothetical protein
MAFSADSFVDISPTSGSYGRVGKECISEKEFKDELLAFENLNMMEAVAGNDSTSGVPMCGEAEKKSHSRAVRLLRMALMDTLMHGYLCAYHGGTSETTNHGYRAAEYDSELHQAGLELIRLACIKQADFLA